MRTTRLLGLLSLSMATFSLAACAPREEPILNRKPDIDLCRVDPAITTFHVDSWEKGRASVDIRFLAHATTPCPARKFPFIDVATRSAAPSAAPAPSAAVTASATDSTSAAPAPAPSTSASPGDSAPPRIIQIVEVNEPIPGGLRHKPSWQIIPEDEPWIFVDMVEDLRDSGEPFVNANRDGRFWDNPAWPDPPKEGHAGGARKWQSRTYAVHVIGRQITAVAGFTWGWTWSVGAKGPEPTPPEPLPRGAWEKDARRMALVYPQWTFN